MSKKSAKPQTEIDSTWYDAEKLIQLVRQYSPRSLDVLEPVSTLDGLKIQLNKVVDGQQGSYFVPLNINAIDKSFNNANHWVGLYISKSKSGFEIKYLDTMGHPINEGISEMINLFGNIGYNIENSLLLYTICKAQRRRIIARGQYKRLRSIFSLLYILFSKWAGHRYPSY